MKCKDQISSETFGGNWPKWFIGYQTSQMWSKTPACKRTWEWLCLYYIPYIYYVLIYAQKPNSQSSMANHDKVLIEFRLMLKLYIILEGLLQPLLHSICTLKCDTEVAVGKKIDYELKYNIWLGVGLLRKGSNICHI